MLHYRKIIIFNPSLPGTDIHPDRGVKSNQINHRFQRRYSKHTCAAEAFRLLFTHSNAQLGPAVPAGFFLLLLLIDTSLPREHLHICHIWRRAERCHPDRLNELAQ